MSNPYTVCRGGAGTENVHIMQQTEANGMLGWLNKKRASPARPADAAHVWAGSPDLQKEQDNKVVEIHELKQTYKAEVFRLQTEINSLKEAISIKDREIVRVNADNSNLQREMSYLDDFKQLCQKQQAEIQSLKRQLPHEVARDVDIGTAAQF